MPRLSWTDVDHDVQRTVVDQNPDSPRLSRHEGRLAAALPTGFPAPRLLHFIDDDHWVALVYEHIDGAPSTA